MLETRIGSRERFKRAFNCEAVDRPPVWFMRQAGRYLPEYRAMKKRYSFLEMIGSPELATEVTLQPLKRFGQLDGAILFSDILVIPQALGQPFHFRDGGGIEFSFTLNSAEQINALGSPNGVREKLSHVPETLRMISGELGGEKALLGFCGSPFTLATYMVEGGSSKNYSKIKSLAYESSKDFHHLMQTLTHATIEYLKMQIEAGVDAIQIFDSNAAICGGMDYWELSLSYVEQIISSLPSNCPPIIFFSKGMSHHAEAMLRTGAKCLSLDWTVDMGSFREAHPGRYALQGNLDPVILNTTPEITERATRRILEAMEGQPGHIFNLGHGVLPEAKIECVEAMLNTVHG